MSGPISAPGIFFVATLLLAGCASSPTAAPDLSPKATKVEAIVYLDSLEVLNMLAPMAPADADVFLTVDTDRMLNEHLVTAFGLLDKDWDHLAMLGDMRAVMLERLKIDFTRAQWAAVFGDGGAFISGDLGGLPEVSETIRGLEVYINTEESMHVVKLKEENLYFVSATREGVEALVDIIHGDSESLAGTQRSKDFERLLTRAGNGDLTVAYKKVKEGDSPDLLPVDIEADGSAISMSDQLVIVIEGPQEAIESDLNKLVALYEDFRTEMEVDVKNLNKDEATAELLTQVFAWHTSKAVMDEFKPTIKDGFLIVDVPMKKVVHPTVIVGGIAAAVSLLAKSIMQGIVGPTDAPHLQN